MAVVRRCFSGKAEAVVLSFSIANSRRQTWHDKKAERDCDAAELRHEASGHTPSLSPARATTALSSVHLQTLARFLHTCGLLQEHINARLSPRAKILCPPH